jgi:RNA polymerase sigma factor (sigma-70 family)
MAPALDIASDPATRPTPAPTSPVRDERLVAIVHSASGGDRDAWEQLYARFTPMLRGVARSYRLSPADVDDAVQTAWLRLVDNIARVREPAAIGGWLTMTTRRECLRLLRGAVRERPSDDPALGDGTASAEPERVLIAAERRAALRRALATLPERQRRLMTLFLTDPSMEYCTVGARLAMPMGSIGPTRARGLARLRDDPELHEFSPSRC